MIEARSLWELLERRVEATPDAVMAVDENGRALTFAEYKAEAERAAAGLARLGVGAGDVVSWQLPTWPGSGWCRTPCCRSTASAKSAS